MHLTVQPARVESRWPPVITTLAVILLLAFLPGRVSIAPTWMAYILGAAILGPMLGVMLGPRKAGWLRWERRALLLFVVFVCAGTLGNLLRLVGTVVSRTGQVDGLALLASSLAVWVNNVLAFSLLYWQVDRGGPEARLNDTGGRPDWLFPQYGAGDDVPPHWRPSFVDYLFLGFSTATAFSTTDAAPLTSRAKLMMMVESAISLGTLALVAARAINILGS